MKIAKIVSTALTAVISMLCCCQIAYSAEVQESSICFADVSETNPYYEAITTLQECGIARGYEGSSFMPDRDITGGSFAAMLDRSFGLGAGTYSNTADITLSQAMEMVTNCVGPREYLEAPQIAITVSHCPNVFDGLQEASPTLHLSRGAAAQLIYNVMQCEKFYI